MGLFSEHGKSLSGQIVKVDRSYYKVISVSAAGMFYCVYRINPPWDNAPYREVMVGCPFDLEGKVVYPALKKYFNLFVP